MTLIGQFIIDFGNFIWGPPLLVLLLGGGLFFLFYSRFQPLFYFRHALGILTGKHNRKGAPGEINHFQALSTAIAGTVGMGNVSGVAVAISMGGPGAIFWMWVSAFIGIITNYFTCALAVMYRGKDDMGKIQGGPMYVIREGLDKRWRFMAYLFSALAMIGVLPMFQANQLRQIITDIVLVPYGIHESFGSSLLIGLLLAAWVALVLIGGLKRIAAVSGSMVPFMIVLYFLIVMYILVSNHLAILPAFSLIITDAFTAKSVLGGSVGAIIVMGVRRAAFSNEAGIGTAPMAHGAAKTNEPVHEGLVAMLGPVIDTLIVCTLTALVIITTGVWQSSDTDGITLTATAISQSIPGIGIYVFVFIVSIFALTTLVALPYYGIKSFIFLFGSKYQNLYKIFYLVSIPVATVSSMHVVISIFDSAYALMAFPTMISAIILAPKVRSASKIYFRQYKKKRQGN